MTLKSCLIFTEKEHAEDAGFNLEKRLHSFGWSIQSRIYMSCPASGCSTGSASRLNIPDILPKSPSSFFMCERQTSAECPNPICPDTSQSSCLKTAWVLISAVKRKADITPALSGLLVSSLGETVNYREPLRNHHLLWGAIISSEEPSSPLRSHHLLWGETGGSLPISRKHLNVETSKQLSPFLLFFTQVSSARSDCFTRMHSLMDTWRWRVCVCVCLSLCVSVCVQLRADVGGLLSALFLQHSALVRVHTSWLQTFEGLSRRSAARHAPSEPSALRAVSAPAPVWACECARRDWSPGTSRSSSRNCSMKSHTSGFLISLCVWRAAVIPLGLDAPSERLWSCSANFWNDCLLRVQRWFLHVRRSRGRAARSFGTLHVPAFREEQPRLQVLLHLDSIYCSACLGCEQRPDRIYQLSDNIESFTDILVSVFIFADIKPFILQKKQFRTDIWHLLIALCSLALFLKKLYFLVPCCSWFVPHGVECTYCKSLWIKASAKWNVM